MSLLHLRTETKPPDTAGQTVPAVSHVPATRHLLPRAFATSGMLLLLAMGFLAWTALHRPAPPPAAKAPVTGGMLIDPASFPTPPFSLRDQNGVLVTPASLRGHVTLVAFLDPVCTSLCPLLGRELAQIEKSLPAVQRPNLVMVSVAPHRTAAQAKKFASEAGLTPGWRFLLGPTKALAPTWKAFHVTVIPRTKDVLHDGAVMVIDRRGRIRDEFYAPFPTTLLTTEVKALAGT